VKGRAESLALFVPCSSTLKLKFANIRANPRYDPFPVGIADIGGIAVRGQEDQFHYADF